ncbi:MAG: hypothetical protein LBC41_02785 [Clostridiales bacterium]|jgi:tetratricopeptide (TPR) repeat protein|nr:hypothetical protein [Clostridiales bacterium]
MEDNAIGLADNYIAQGNAFLVARKYEEALQELNKAQAILDALDDNEEVIEFRARCYESKSSALVVLNRLQESLPLLEKSVSIRSSRVYKVKRKQIEVFAILTWSLYCLGKYAEAIKYANKFMDSYDIEEEIDDAGASCSFVGKVLMCDAGRNLEKAKKAFLMAQTVFMKAMPSPSITEILVVQSALAVIYSQYEHDSSKAHLALEQAWRLAEKAGLENCYFEQISEIVSTGMSVCSTFPKGYQLWFHRLRELWGLSIDQGYLKIVPFYVVNNVELFLETAQLDDSVTLERVTKCVEYMSSLTNRPTNTLTQWLAGCAFFNLGTTREIERNGFRLIKASVQALEDTIEVAAYAIGQGYIADYHFQKGEYELAKGSYRSAIKNLKTASNCVREKFMNHYQRRLKECSQRLSKD